MRPNPQVLDVCGEFACFSRPELKVERFSYPVITPSAARGIFDAIYSKPNKDPTQAQFRWQVTQIEVLKPITYITLRRNEVKDVANVAAIERWATGKAEPEPIWADGDRDLLGTDEKGRTQRQTMALKDVRYRLHAEIRPWLGHAHKLASLEAQFRRRAAQGKCFHQPYFGCREFPAYFELVDEEEADEPRAEIPDQDLGFMLYDVFDLSRPGTPYDAPSISLFKARLQNGALDVPEYESPEVLKPGKEGN